MKKIFLVAGCCFFMANLFAQEQTGNDSKKKLDPRQINLSNRSNDHLMIQLGYNGWAGIPDTIDTKGLPRTFNMYFMLDMPFKTDKRFSAAIGVGIATENMYFNKTSIGLKETSGPLKFKSLADTNYFKKYKMGTAWLEAPLELRYSSTPLNNKNSLKAALGIKVGTLVNAHTKGKNLLTKTGSPINNYSEKINSKRYFNTTRVQMTGRVGKGNMSLFGNYQVNTLFKEALGPAVRPYTIGISISGL
jgi:hypothetical protein